MPYLRQAARNSSSETSATIMSRSVVVHDDQLVDAHAALVAGVVAACRSPCRRRTSWAAACSAVRPSSMSTSGLGVNSVRQLAQIFRTSRWARTASTVAVIRNVGRPMSRSRVIGRRGVVGVQRGEDDVPGERRLDRDLGRLQVAGLADQDLVRVLPEDRPQAGGEGHADLGVDRHLDQAVDVVLDRLLGGDDLVLDLVQLVERGVERGRLARRRSAR